MNEQLPAEKQTSKITPLDLANLALHRIRNVENEAEIDPIVKAGDVIEQDGVKLMYIPEYYSSKKIIDGTYASVQLPYTYRQYYSHSFEDESTNRMIPAPGWDLRFRLQDNETTQRVHGRSFTAHELSDVPNSLPDDEALFLRPVDSYEVEEYLESREVR